MVAVGSKYGMVGCWNMDPEKEEGDGTYLYRPHSSPIGGILIQPFNIAKVLLSFDASMVPFYSPVVSIHLSFCSQYDVESYEFLVIRLLLFAIINEPFRIPMQHK